MKDSADMARLASDLQALAYQLHRRAIDAQRLCEEAPRHEMTPGFIEYPDSPPPTFEESADFEPSRLTDHDVYRHAEEKIDEQ